LPVAIPIFPKDFYMQSLLISAAGPGINHFPEYHASATGSLARTRMINFAGARRTISASVTLRRALLWGSARKSSVMQHTTVSRRPRAASIEATPWSRR
jgi:hypothetical protein